MATPRKGPSFSGPVGGWTASSLTPVTTTVAAAPPPVGGAGLTAAQRRQMLSTPGANPQQFGWTFNPGTGWTSNAPAAINPATGQPFSYTLAGPTDFQVNPITGTGSPLSDESIRATERWAGLNLPAISGRGTGIDSSAVGGGGGGGSGGSSSSSSGSVGSMAAGGRGAGFGNRGAFTVPTPLESLLASIFPDEAAGPAAASPNPNTAAPQGSELFRTILGNLGTSGGFSGGVAPAPVFAPQSFGGASTGAQIASTIPGAPAFLGGAINRVNTAGMAAPMAPTGGGFNPAGIAALAAEQRIQAAEAEKIRREAEAAWFEQQQQQQRAQAMTAQRQRQRFGGINALTSGWGSSPLLY